MFGHGRHLPIRGPLRVGARVGVEHDAGDERLGFLSSDAASFVTGQGLIVDAGITPRLPLDAVERLV